MFKMTERCHQQMIEDARKGLPNEACGILAGEIETASVFYSMKNIDQNPVSYLMDPKEQFQVMKQIRSRGEKMLGIYHSHVASQAYPSAKDIGFASYPEIHYVIVSLTDRKRPSARVFRIEEGKVREDSIEIV